MDFVLQACRKNFKLTRTVNWGLVKARSLTVNFPSAYLFSCSHISLSIENVIVHVFFFNQPYCCVHGCTFPLISRRHGVKGVLCRHWGLNISVSLKFMLKQNFHCLALRTFCKEVKPRGLHPGKQHQCPLLKGHPRVSWSLHLLCQSMHAFHLLHCEDGMKKCCRHKRPSPDTDSTDCSFRLSRSMRNKSLLLLHYDA